MAQERRPAATIDEAWGNFGTAVDRKANSPALPVVPSGVDPTDPTIGSFSATDAQGRTAASLAVGQTDILKFFYEDVRTQTTRSFWQALIVSLLGFFVVMVAVVLGFTGTNNNAITPTAIAGVVIEIVGGLQFYLYNRTVVIMSNFHNRLMRVQRFLLADDLVEEIIDPAKRDQSRLDLIAAIYKAEGDKEIPDAPPVTRPGA